MKKILLILLIVPAVFSGCQKSAERYPDFRDFTVMTDISANGRSYYARVTYMTDNITLEYLSPDSMKGFAASVRGNVYETSVEGLKNISDSAPEHSHINLLLEAILAVNSNMAECSQGGGRYLYKGKSGGGNFVLTADRDSKKLVSLEIGGVEFSFGE